MLSSTVPQTRLKRQRDSQLHDVDMMRGINVFGPLLPFGVRRRILQSRPLMLSQRPPIGHVRFAASIGQSIGHLRDRLLGRDRSRRKAKTEPQAVDLAADLERFNLRFGGRHHGPQT